MTFPAGRQEEGETGIAVPSGKVPLFIREGFREFLC
jgi:hypothetical protein